MKTIRIVVLMMLTATFAYAQQETLVGDGFHSGGYGGPVWGVTTMKGASGFFAGGRGGWIINRTVALGGGGYGLIGQVNSEVLSPNGKPMYIHMSYGGFEMEYIRDSEKLIHWTIHLHIGGGQVELKEKDPIKFIKNESIFVLEPSAQVNLNVTPWFRLGAAASYRAVMGVSMPELSNQDLSGPAAWIMMKFGAF